MKYPLTLTLLLAVALLAEPAPAAPKGIHLKTTRTASFMWNRQDAKGFRWDISSNGSISDGTNDAYDGGMQLQIQGNSYPGLSNGRLSKDGTEVEIGPWSYANLKVYRRVFINVKGGYCRWIDIFENDTARDVSVTLRYYFNMGDSTQRIFTTGGKGSLSKGDWGVVTGAASSSSRPTIVHIFGSRGAKFLPRFQFNVGNDNLYYHAKITVPAKKAAALVFFEAQRRPFSSAQKFLKSFNTSQELRLVPRPLRKIILNMGPAGIRVGALEIARDDETDLIALRNGDEYRGTLINTEYALTTEFGEMKFPAAKVLALSSISSVHADAYVVLTDGQVIAGRLTSGPVKIRLAGSSELPVNVTSIVQASYRISDKRPEEIAPAPAMLQLRSGPRLAFTGMTQFSFLTPHGTVSIPADALRSIEMDTPGGGLHRAIFRNGSVLGGLLPEDKLSLKLALGQSIEVDRARVKRLAMGGPAVDNGDLAELTLRNADVLYGRIADASWTVKSKFGDVKVETPEIASAAFSQDSLSEVKLVLHSGTKIGGRLAGDYIRFAIEPGTTVKLHVGHLETLKGGPAPADKTTTTRPATDAAVNAVPGDAATTGQPTVLSVRLKQLQAEKAQLMDVGKKLQAMAKELKARARAGGNLGAAPAKQFEQIAKQMAENRARLAKVEAAIQALHAAPVPVTPPSRPPPTVRRGMPGRIGPR